jgi:hypothetical protein
VHGLGRQTHLPSGVAPVIFGGQHIQLSIDRICCPPNSSNS